MPTLKELTYNLRDIIRGGRVSDDDPLTNRQLEFIISYSRNLLIKKYSKQKNMIANAEQDLGCVPIICVDKANCCNIKSNTQIFRTKEKVPNFVSYPDSVMYVGLPDKQQGFELSSYNQTRWSKYAKYTSRLTRTYFIEDYIFITNYEHPILKSVNIRGIFEDPKKAFEFSQCETDCKEDFDNSTYPIDAWMITEMNKLILEQELKYLLLTKSDDENDARNEGSTNRTSAG